MELDWDDVLRRYGDGAEVPSLPGGAAVTVTGADDDRIYIKHRLWSDSLSRVNLERGIALVDKGEMTRLANRFIDQYRTMVADERPTMAATVLKDLGYLD